MAALTKANLKQVQATVDDALDGLLEDLRGAAAANTGLSVQRGSNSTLLH